ncbi:hypothetical protein EG329_007700 [Mollisiaceae sp. DMI_Dod_QoI]|nr:hypothetical protein EG329_007700 [Helotiales sp. DMI_Dod_QoI]
MDEGQKTEQTPPNPDLKALAIPAASGTPEIITTPASSKTSPTSPTLPTYSPDLLQVPSPAARNPAAQWLVNEIANSTPFDPSLDAVIAPLSLSRKSSPVIEDDVVGLSVKPLSFASQEPLIVVMASKKGSLSGSSGTAGTPDKATPTSSGPTASGSGPRPKSSGKASASDDEMEDVDLSKDENAPKSKYSSLFVKPAPKRKFEPLKGGEKPRIMTLSGDMNEEPVEIDRIYDPTARLAEERRKVGEDMRGKDKEFIEELGRKRERLSKKKEGEKEEDLQEDQPGGKKITPGGKRGGPPIKLPNPIVQNPAILEFRAAAQKLNEGDACYDIVDKAKKALDAALRQNNSRTLKDREAIVKLESVNVALQNVLEDMDKRLLATRKDKQYSDEDVEVFKAEIKRLTKFQNEADNNQASSARKLQDEQRKVRTLEAEKKKLQDNAKTYAKKIADLETDKSRLELDKPIQETENEQHAEDVASKQQQIDNLQNENEALKAIIAQLESGAKNIITTADCVNLNKSKKDALQARIRALSLQLPKIKDASKDSELVIDQLKGLEAELENLEESDFVTNKECTERVKEYAAGLQLTINEGRSRIELLETAVSSEGNASIYIETIKALKEKLKKLEKDMEDMVSREVAEGDVKKWQDENKELETELEGVKLALDIQRFENDKTLKEKDEELSKKQAMLQSLQTRGTNMLTQEMCKKMNEAEVERLTAEITGLKQELAAARKVTPVPNLDENKTLRQRVAELDIQLEKVKEENKAQAAELKGRGILPEENNELEQCREERGTLKAEIERLGKEITNSNNNRATLERIATRCREAQQKTQEREFAALAEVERLKKELAEALRTLEAEVDESIEKDQQWSDSYNELLEQNRALTQQTGNEALIDSQKRLEVLRQEATALEAKLKQAEKELKAAEAEIEQLQEVQTATVANCDTLLSEEYEKNKKLEAEVTRLTAEIESLSQKFNKAEDQLIALQPLIDAAIEQNGDGLQKCKEEVERLTAESRRLKDELENRPNNPDSGDDEEVVRLVAELPRVKRELQEQKNLLEGLRDQIRKSDVKIKAHERLLRENNIPFSVRGGSDGQDDGLGTPALPLRELGAPVTSYLQVELAILRARVEMNHVIQCRAQTGFVENDTDSATAAIGLALDLVAQLPGAEDDLKYQAEAYFWDFLIKYYSGDLIEATAALDVAGELRIYLESEEDREAVVEWRAYNDLPPVPSTREAYGGGSSKRRTSGSSLGSVRQTKKSKKDKGREKVADENKKKRKDKKEKDDRKEKKKKTEV